MSDYFFEKLPEKRYISNLIGLAFLILSFISIIFIKEDLKRYKKDVQLQQEKIESIDFNKFKDNEEYLINSKKNSDKSL